MPETHTQQCVQVEAARAAWKAAWPNHCPTCEGHGGKESSFDPSPRGISLASGSMSDFEPCEDCICKGKCPRCGNQHPEPWSCDGIDPCDSCGWNEQNASDKCPESICACWELEANKQPFVLPDVYREAQDLYDNG